MNNCTHKKCNKEYDILPSCLNNAWKENKVSQDKVCYTNTGPGKMNLLSVGLDKIPTQNNTKTDDSILPRFYTKGLSEIKYGDIVYDLSFNNNKTTSVDSSNNVSLPIHTTCGTIKDLCGKTSVPCMNYGQYNLDRDRHNSNVMSPIYNYMEKRWY